MAATDEADDPKSGADTEGQSGFFPNDRPRLVAVAPRKITPSPMVSPYLAKLVEAAYRMGWEDRAQVETDIRAGLIESPSEGEKIEPEKREGCPLCGASQSER